MKEKKENPESCQFYYGAVVKFSSRDDRVDIVRRCWRLFQHYLVFAPYRFPFIGTLIRPFMKPALVSVPVPFEPLNLEPGDLVEVRSLEEIRATLDGKNRYKGLYFMPEMEKFAGKQFRVFKKVERIKLETTGQMRKIMSPTVFLEGVICDGCDRACLCFWKEVWLKRVP